MDDLRSLQSNDIHHQAPSSNGASQRHSSGRDDWEDWEDDEPVTPSEGEDGEDLLLDLVGDDSPGSPNKAPLPSRKSSHVLPATRQSAGKPKRLKSRARQKAQNAKAGIKLVTDTAKLRRQQQHVAYQLKLSAQSDTRRAPFQDAAALQALEGDQSRSSVGSWHWLKKNPSKASSFKRNMSQKSQNSIMRRSDLSPNDRPIMIGLALPSDDLNSRMVSPLTSTTDSPVSFKRSQPVTKAGLTQSPQMRSVWSPDTEDGADSPFRAASSRVASSIYSQPGTIFDVNAPPVPAVPSAFKGGRLDMDDDDDNFTPVTLFEEDGSPVTTRTKSTRSRGHTRSPATVGTVSGWWDHVKTPFIEQSSHNPFAPGPKPDAQPQQSNNPFAKKPMEIQPEPSKEAATDWWVGVDEKKGAAKNLGISIAAANNTGSTRGRGLSPTMASSSRLTPVLQQSHQRQPELRTRDASEAPSMRAQLTGGSSSSAGAQSTAAQSHSEKARILAQENEMPTPADEPPPYSPPSQKQQAQQNNVRYRAVFPPGHPLGSQFPPSPGPESPGLGNTMTSQGAIRMTDVPLTPAAAHLGPADVNSDTPLPERAPGTFVPGDHFHDTLGNSPAARTERRRRRHEKEDVVARKVGGLWRGRGCIPETGCFGRMGREGRKRRRIWLGAIGTLIAVIILVVVLVVVLLRKTVAPAANRNIWLNLTDFPPIPTGVLTVIGADNSEDVSTCVMPATLWSCSLPREQAVSNLPYVADQPDFVLQIQYDNSTSRFWNVPDGAVPTPTPIVPLGGGGAAEQGDVGKGLDLSLTRKSLAGRAVAGVRAVLGLRQNAPANPGFTPVPVAPSFQEMWFLGNTTDFIVSDRKAGEATPFFLSFLPTIDSQPVGPNAVPASVLSKRGGNGTITIGNQTVQLPLPPMNADGTGKPAVLFPHPVQQPLRLYDRGLATEHFGFYTYFNKTIYLKSITPLNNDTHKEGDVPADREGGSLQSEANFVTMWSWTRFHVQIWTRRQAVTKLNKPDLRSPEPGSAEAAMSPEQLLEVRRPGTFPYPITISQDTHGGDRAQKGTINFAVDARGEIDLDKVSFQINNMYFANDLINPRGRYNPSFGGMDGGHGGCKCGWTNFVGVDGRVVGPGAA